MRDRLGRIFQGRHGMDELSKALFWCGLLCMALSILTTGLINNVLSSIFSWLGLFQIIYGFFRAFSRRLGQRDAENSAYLVWRQQQKKKLEDFKERRRQSRDFKFFKCPGCHSMMRVPRGKGKLHIKCKCGYTMYRKT